eukprot:CAMPEP_0185169432 /NCGR_PEP_ID=MMETSP1139-20130426/17261_1 /TAXON_ID=298111 /ORGANISM="Pavlova sp., Strain CCMP459" /LENGTH=249 /DNA_ID=CAMNT_0027734967 /DNA_START=9 /DNA_END=755 /DNA_ORIENTATION=+
MSSSHRRSESSRPKHEMTAMERWLRDAVLACQGRDHHLLAALSAFNTHDIERVDLGQWSRVFDILEGCLRRAADPDAGITIVSVRVHRSVAAEKKPADGSARARSVARPAGDGAGGTTGAAPEQRARADGSSQARAASAPAGSGSSDAPEAPAGEGEENTSVLIALAEEALRVSAILLDRCSARHSYSALPWVHALLGCAHHGIVGRALELIVLLSRKNSPPSHSQSSQRAHAGLDDAELHATLATLAS